MYVYSNKWCDIKTFGHYCPLLRIFERFSTYLTWPRFFLLACVLDSTVCSSNILISFALRLFYAVAQRYITCHQSWSKRRSARQELGLSLRFLLGLMWLVWIWVGVMEASFELRLKTCDVLFCPLHGTSGFLTIYSQSMLKFSSFLSVLLFG